MRVLVACEYSATVRDAFLRAGHDAVSCDILPTESTEFTDPALHHQGDVRDILGDGWDLMVAHPPCTYLTNAGARWLYQKGTRIPIAERWHNMREGAEFFRMLWEADIPRIAVENPVMMRHAKIVIGGGRPVEPTQTFQPYEFGHMETKRTCLWLKNLPPLSGTKNVKAETMALPYGERAKVHHASPGPDRQKIRSMFFRGVADAMAEQWGSLSVASIRVAA